MKELFSYSDSIQDAIVSTLVDTAVKSITTLFKRKSKKVTTENKLSFEEKVLVNHFNELYNWCKELEFIGLGGKPISTIINTIKLDYCYSKNRKVIDNDHTTSSIKEDDFIFTHGNIIIEGDPGSGKTTTLKRILYNYFFNDQPKESFFSYPILVRFRSINTGLTLYTHIATLLGIEYETQQEAYEVEVMKIRMVKKEGMLKDVEERYIDKEIKHRPIHFINKERIETALINFLEINNILLILDGLDEVKPELFEPIQEQIKEIGLKLFNSKIIITSRPNYIKVAYPNFSIYEVGQLSIEQIMLISKLWISDYSVFIKQLEKKSYFELANRPLFLCFLILLFIENKKEGETNLPKSSKDVYEQIIELLVFKWDKERNIKRKSKYSDFDERKKVRFLSHLSFRLTYIIKEKIFSHTQLVDAYVSICPYFDLPKKEAELVAEEIENHTGIIIKSMYKKYEFSHLAIQEYLCAIYIIGAPFNEKINKYLVEYTPPLALAVALSTDSALWLTELIHKILNSNNTLEEKTNISAQILYRLNIESPYFEYNIDLGVALLSLCKICHCNNTAYSINFDKVISENSNIEKAILQILSSYRFTGKNDVYNRISFKKKYVYGNDFPDVLCLPQTSYIVKALEI